MFCSIAAVLVAGCGGGGADDLPDLGLVTGTIKIDGEPTEDVSVTFSPADNGRASTGRTDADGNYELYFNSSTPGAIVGKHNVFVAGYVEFDPNAPDAPMIPPEGNVPRDYGNISKEVTVEPGVNDIDLSWP